MRPTTTRHRPTAWTASALLAVALAVTSARPAAAQDAPEAEDHEGQSFQVGDADELRRRLDDFERLSAAEDWELAVDELQALLDVPPEQGLVIRVRGNGMPRYHGAGHVAHRMFAALPPAGRAEWEELYRADAEALLDRGLRLRNDADLAAAIQRYPADDVRRRAYDARARLAFARGQFASGRAALERLATLAETDAERAGITARIAFALAQSGDRIGVDRLITLSGTLKEEQVPGGDGLVRLGTFLRDMARAAGPATASGGWPMYGGATDGLPLRYPLPVLSKPSSDNDEIWRMQTGFVEGSQTYTDRTRRQRLGHRPVQPAVSRNVVYVNSGLAVFAIDVSSGHILWLHRGPHHDADWRDNRHMVHGAAVVGDVVYAAVASRSDAPNMERLFYGHPIVYPLPHRTLVALDTRSGDVLWSHDDASLARTEHPDTDLISAESVASPPLVVGDDLLVASWRWEALFSVRVVCYDRHTGHTRWRRNVTLGQQELNLFGRPVKELATTALAERDGVIYFGTNLGVVAALDRESGNVVWLTTYPQTPIPRSEYWYQTVERGVRWHPGPVVVTDRHLLIAPTESPNLLAIERDTGKIAWLRRDRDRALRNEDWFLGVQDGRAYTLGDHLSATFVETGKPAFSVRLKNEKGQSRPAGGAGVLAKDGVLVGTTDSLLRLDSATGKLISETPMRRGGDGAFAGDLLSADGVLFAITQSAVTAHYDPVHRRAELLRRLANDPDDPRLRLEAGEVFRLTGDLDDAVSSLEVGLRNITGLAARARERIEGPLRRSLYDAYSDRGASRRKLSDIAGAIEDFERAADIASDDAAAVLALFEVAAVAESKRRRQAYERILQEYAGTRVTFPSGERRHAGAYAAFMLGDELSVRGDVQGALRTWLDLLEEHADEDLGKSDVRGGVHQRLARLAETQPNQVNKAVRERSRSAFERARDRADASALDRVARLYPHPETAVEAALLAAQIHIGAGDPRPAVTGLRRLLGTKPPAASAARLLVALADAYRAFDDPSSERAALTRLAREHGDVQLSGQSALAFATARLADPRLVGPSVELPRPEPPLVKIWERKGHGVAPRIVAVHGRHPDGLEERMLATRGDTMLAIGERTGEVEWMTPVATDPRHGVIGHRGLVIVAGSEKRAVESTVLVEAFRAHDGQPAWARRLAGRHRSHALGEGVLYVLWRAPMDASGAARYHLSSIDLSSGEVAADRTLEGPVNEQLVVSDNAVLVFRTIVNGGRAQRVAEVLDGGTLALRGRVAYDSGGSQRLAAAVPERPVVVGLSGATSLIGIDVHTGERAWTKSLGEIPIATLLPVPGGLITIDGEGHLRRLSPDGEERWSADLSVLGSFAFGGSAAADGTVVVPVVQSGSGKGATIVAIDAGSGEELWRVPIALARRAMPRATITRNHVAIEINENLGRGQWRSRVVFLNRENGETEWELSDPELSKSFLKVRYDRSFVVLATLGTGGQHVVVYGK